MQPDYPRTGTYHASQQNSSNQPPRPPGPSHASRIGRSTSGSPTTRSGCRSQVAEDQARPDSRKHHDRCALSRACSKWVLLRFPSVSLLFLSTRATCMYYDVSATFPEKCLMCVHPASFYFGKEEECSHKQHLQGETERKKCSWEVSRDRCSRASSDTILLSTICRKKSSMRRCSVCVSFSNIRWIEIIYDTWADLCPNRIRNIILHTKGKARHYVATGAVSCFKIFLPRTR
jgi:hypothetical protein